MTRAKNRKKKVTRRILVKAELLPRVRGRRSQNRVRELFKIPSDEEKPGITYEARHLGPYCHHAYSTRRQRQRRTNAAHRSAAFVTGLRKTNTRYATKRAALFARGWPDSLGSRISTILHSHGLENLRSNDCWYTKQEPRVSNQGRIITTCHRIGGVDPGRHTEHQGNGGWSRRPHARSGRTMDETVLRHTGGGKIPEVRHG